MRRDMDLIRDLLLRLEEMDMEPGNILVVGEDLEAEGLAVQGYDSEHITYHLSLIYEAGFVNYGAQAQVYGGFMFRGLT